MTTLTKKQITDIVEARCSDSRSWNLLVDDIYCALNPELKPLSEIEPEEVLRLYNVFKVDIPRFTNNFKGFVEAIEEFKEPDNAKTIRDLALLNEVLNANGYKL